MSTIFPLVFGQTRLSNVDLHQTPHYTPQNVLPDQGLHCLPLIQHFLDTRKAGEMDLKDKNGKMDVPLIQSCELDFNFCLKADLLSTVGSVTQCKSKVSRSNSGLAT